MKKSLLSSCIALAIVGLPAGAAFAHTASQPAAAVAPAVALGAAIVRPCLRFLHPRVTAPPRMLLCCCRRIQALFNALGEEAVGKTIGLGGDGRYFNKEAVQVRCA